MLGLALRMRTRELARTLMAFAELAELERSDSLYRFACYFEKGRDETVQSRLTRMSPANRHPSNLRLSLESIQLGLKAAGARKQAAALASLLKLFGGRGDATTESFLLEISTVTRKKTSTSVQADESLARAIIDKLNRPSQNQNALGDILIQLSSSTIVNKSTLCLIANSYLENGNAYRDRKSAIKAILNRYSNKVLVSRVNAACSKGE